MSEIVLQYTRAGHVENIHRGDIAAVNCAGEIVFSVGNALPFAKNGGLEKAEGF